MKKNGLYIGLGLLAVYWFFFRKSPGSASANPFPSYGGTVLPQLTLPKNTGGLGNTSSHVSPVSPAGSSIPISGIGSAIGSLGNLVKGIAGLFKSSPDKGTGNSDSSGSQGLSSAVDPFSLKDLGKVGSDATDFGGVPVLPTNSIFASGQERPFMLSDYTGNYASNFDVSGWSVPSLSNDLITVPNSDSYNAAYSSAFDSAPVDPNFLSTPLSGTSLGFVNDGNQYTWNGSSFDTNVAAASDTGSNWTSFTGGSDSGGW